MNIQTKACFKKEFLAFFRTNTFLIIACVIIGLAILSPALMAGMGALMDAMSDIYDEMGMDVSDMTAFISESASMGVAFSIDGIVGTSVIVVLLLLNRTAGGEQKKRAMIIPKSAGLRSFPYIFPKFIIYPLTVFILSVIAILVSWPISILLFNVNDVSFTSVLLIGVLTGVSLMFYVCCHLALGTATGKAGMSAAICITMSVLFPLVFASIGTDYMFNPFALGYLATSVLQWDVIPGSELLDIAVSVIFALGIMLVTYFIALFAQNARKTDNTGEDLEL